MKWNIVIGSLVLGLGLSTQSFGLDLLDRMLGMDYGGGGSKASCCETKADPDCGCDLGCDSKCVQKGCTPLLDKLRCHLGSGACQKGGGKACQKSDCCEVDPGCMQKSDPCLQKSDCGKGGCKSCTPLLDKLRCRLASLRSCKSGKGGKGDCCEKDPGCCTQKSNGCLQKCSDPCGDSKCVQKSHGSLLDRIFSCRACQKGKGSCGKVDPGCGCEPSCGMDYVPADGPKEADAPEAAPTPPAPVVDPSAFLPTKRRFIQTTLVR